MSDGIDHINIYSKGLTPLGRALSNFSADYVLTLDGRFESIEGYWYWLGLPDTHPRREGLRLAAGWEAKKLGKEIRTQLTCWVVQPDFRLRIINAMTAKLILHPSLLPLLRDSTLPFRHYYLYGGKKIEPEKGRWIVETWEHLRKVLRSP